MRPVININIVKANHKNGQRREIFAGIHVIAKRFIFLFSAFFLLADIQGQYVTYTSSGTFTVPAGITSILVECWGGGGAGGAATGNPAAGGGGAGGAYARRTVTVVPGNTYTVTVGTGGTGGGGTGPSGNPSWFGTAGTVYAQGGAGGARAIVNNTNGAGGTGSAGSSIGDITYRGGNGAAGIYTSGTPGGAGGGGAGSTGTGNDASAGVGGAAKANYGGAGANGVANSTDGANGYEYGGGGSGGKANTGANHNGGSGANGLVIITLSPYITSQPSDFSGCTATFSIVATGSAPLTYQWQENSGGGFTNISDGGVYSGATTSSLIISGATTPMSGYLYRCVVTDGLSNTATSNSATLTVVLPTLTFGYSYSMDVTLNQASGSSDLTDFPALISFTNSSIRTIANGGHVSNASGYDIIFTDQNGNKLDHQIEYYNPATGNYVAWVRIPLLSHTSTTMIKMYYGNSSVSADPSVKSVWTSSYKGVWHLNGTDFTDGTSYSNDGTNSNTSNITGKIAGGRGFNGTNSYIQVTTNGFVPNDNNQTISVWGYYSAAPGDNRNLVSFQNAGASSAIQVGFRGGHAVAWKWGGVILADGGVDPSINTWHYYVYTYDGTTSHIYIDGTEINNSTVAPQTALPSEGNIGRYNSGEYFNGYIDEARFSISPKSAGWIQTEYNNQNNPSTFISLGSEVDATLLTTLGVCSTTYTLDLGYPAGGSYSGTGVSGTNFNASVAGVGTHPITYFYTDPTGCSNSAIKNIVVTAMPSAPAASNKECCYLNIVDLEATGTNLKWYSDAALTTLAGNGTPFATGKTAAGVYTYYVTQTVNGCESSATTVSLTILDGITITAQPQPATICSSGNGSFTVAATGYNLTYQWQVNTVNITDGGVYSGATTPTLTLTNPGIGLSGSSYLCVISSACGSSPLNSNGAALTVTQLPVATFSYAGTPYCPNAANPSPAFSGGGVAGTFSSTAGLVFVSTATGQVDLAASTPGDYTVTNTIAAAGGCGIVQATSPISIISGLTWTGSSGTDWNTPGNWSCNYVPLQATDIIIPNVANKPVISSGAIGTINNLVINSGSSLTVNGNTIRISGTITSAGTFTASSGTVELNGTAAQSIAADLFAGNTIGNLTINNASGVTLQGPLNVSGMVNLTSGTLSSGGNLTLLSTAAQTGLISGSGSGNVTGNVTIQRYLPSGFGYKYFSSPVQSATVNEFSDDMTLGAFTFFRYNENSTTSGWVSYHTPVTNPLVPLEGYAVNFGSGSAPNTVDISGAVNSGNVSATLYNHHYTYTDGFNLVGNPYPSPIDWDAVAGWTKTNIDDAVYYFKASTTDQYGGTYSTYIGGVSSDGLASNIIPSMQGFFVRVSNGAFPVTGTLAMNNSVRINDLTHSFTKSKGTTSAQLIRLTSYFSDAPPESDPMLIYFNDKASDEFDSQLDALKLFNTDLKVPNLYAVTPSGSKLSINAIPFITNDLYTVPLGLKLNRAGTIIIKIRDIDDSLTDMDIYLSDVLTGTNYNLLPNKEFSLTLGTGEYLNRFYLNFSNLATDINDFKPYNNLINIYSYRDMVKAEINLLPGEKGILKIFSLTGKVLFIKQIDDSGHYEFHPGLKSGFYIVSFMSGSTIVSKKVIIEN